MTEPQKRLTLEELRAKTAKAIKEATTFEKTPTYDMTIGQEILFMVEKVAEGKFGTPIVIARELRVMDGNGKFAVPPVMRAYTQEGLTAPRIMTEVKAGEKIRAPTFVVRRAQEKKLEFHANQVYWAKYIEDVKVEKGTFKVTAVDLVGTEFPDA